MLFANIYNNKQPETSLQGQDEYSSKPESPAISKMFL